MPNPAIDFSCNMETIDPKTVFKKCEKKRRIQGNDLSKIGVKFVKMFI